MRIAVFDYRVIATNPVGGCHLRMLSGLCRQHDFTVFAVEFENPCPERIRWVRIPLPVRPYVLLYVLYHLAAPLVYFYQYLVRGARFDVVQIVESNLLFGDVSYSHFCHRRYLKHHWQATRGRGLRGMLRGLAHRMAAWMEPLVYRRVRSVVVPSRGLSHELGEEYPAEQSKIRLLPNPVDVEGLKPPAQARRDELRRQLGASAENVVLVFAALGHFERKGLPLVLDAMQQTADPRIQLIVVGGEPGLVAEYRARAAQSGLEHCIRFEGMQRDLKPYYWAADAFIFPSYYETFSLVSFEAAAARLPLLVTHLNGVEEVLEDQQNGLLMERSVEGIVLGIRRLLALTEEQRLSMGERARQSAMRYSSDNFVAAWRTFYERLA